MLCAYNKLKIESIVTIMTNDNIRVAKLAFTIVQIQKQPLNSAHENTTKLKSHPNVQTTSNCFVSTMGLISIIRFNIRLLPFTKFMEFLKSRTVKAGWNVFSDFPASI